MACFHPMEAERLVDGRVVFVRKAGMHSDAPLVLPCGQCRGCRLERSRQWALRCVHESRMHDQSCFLTLTLDDANLGDGDLDVRLFQRFMKRLRKHSKNRIRFYHCGEYGDRYGRPHYHAIIWGTDFIDDQVMVGERDGLPYYYSPTLARLWPHGTHRIGSVTWESAAYVARYCMKKINGDEAEEHYAKKETVDITTGEVKVTETFKPEYATMSRGGRSSKGQTGGIGAGFFEKYKHEIYRDDFIIHDGKKYRPPKFYDGRFEIENPERLQEVKEQRIEKAERHKPNNTPQRRKVRERIQQLQTKRLKRDFE